MAKKTSSKPVGKRSEVKDDDTLDTEDEDEGGGVAVEEAGEDEFEVPDVVTSEDDDEDTDDEEEEDTEDDDDEDTEDEDDDSEPADTKPKAKAKKPAAKAKPAPKAKPAAKSKADDADDENEAEPGAMSKLQKKWAWSPDFETCDVPLSQLKEPKHGRVPTDEAVDAMARNIKAVGLLNPITIGTDNVIVAGRTRFRAFKKLNRDTIPSRFAVSKDGEALKSSDAFAAMQTLSENVRRSDLTPMQKGKFYKQAIEGGVADDTGALAKMLGESRGTIDKYIALVDQGTKALHEALDEDRITVEAAIALIRRCKDDQKAQKSALQALLDAADGKAVQSSDVDKKTSKAQKTKRGKGTGSGRRPSKSDVSDDVMNTLETGASMVLRKTETGSLIELRVEIAHDGAFTKFDFHRAVAEQLAKIDAKALRSELDVIRKRLDGEQ